MSDFSVFFFCLVSGENGEKKIIKKDWLGWINDLKVFINWKTDDCFFYSIYEKARIYLLQDWVSGQSCIREKQSMKWNRSFYFCVLKNYKYNCFPVLVINRQCMQYVLLAKYIFMYKHNLFRFKCRIQSQHLWNWDQHITNNWLAYLFFYEFQKIFTLSN